MVTPSYTREQIINDLLTYLDRFQIDEYLELLDQIHYPSFNSVLIEAKLGIIEDVLVVNEDEPAIDILRAYFTYLQNTPNKDLSRDLLSLFAQYKQINGEFEIELDSGRKIKFSEIQSTSLPSPNIPIAAESGSGSASQAPPTQYNILFQLNRCILHFRLLPEEQKNSILEELITGYENDDLTANLYDFFSQLTPETTVKDAPKNISLEAIQRLAKLIQAQKLNNLKEILTNQTNFLSRDWNFITTIGTDSVLIKYLTATSDDEDNESLRVAALALPYEDFNNAYNMIVREIGLSNTEVLNNAPLSEAVIVPSSTIITSPATIPDHEITVDSVRLAIDKLSSEIINDKKKQWLIKKIVNYQVELKAFLEGRTLDSHNFKKRNKQLKKILKEIGDILFAIDKQNGLASADNQEFILSIYNSRIANYINRKTKGAHQKILDDWIKATADLTKFNTEREAKNAIVEKRYQDLYSFVELLSAIEVSVFKMLAENPEYITKFEERKNEINNPFKLLEIFSIGLKIKIQQHLAGAKNLTELLQLMHSWTLIAEMLYRKGNFNLSDVIVDSLIECGRKSSANLGVNAPRLQLFLENLSQCLSKENNAVTPRLITFLSGLSKAQETFSARVSKRPKIELYKEHYADLQKFLKGLANCLENLPGLDSYPQDIQEVMPSFLQLLHNRENLHELDKDKLRQALPESQSLFDSVQAFLVEMTNNVGKNDLLSVEQKAIAEQFYPKIGEVAKVVTSATESEKEIVSMYRDWEHHSSAETEIPFLRIAPNPDIASPILSGVQQIAEEAIQREKAVLLAAFHDTSKKREDRVQAALAFIKNYESAKDDFEDYAQTILYVFNNGYSVSLNEILAQIMFANASGGNKSLVLSETGKRLIDKGLTNPTEYSQFFFIFLKAAALRKDNFSFTDGENEVYFKKMVQLLPALPKDKVENFVLDFITNYMAKKLHDIKLSTALATREQALAYIDEFSLFVTILLNEETVINIAKEKYLFRNRVQQLLEEYEKESLNWTVHYKFAFVMTAGEFNRVTEAYQYTFSDMSAVNNLTENEVSSECIQKEWLLTYKEQLNDIFKLLNEKFPEKLKKLTKNKTFANLIASFMVADAELVAKMAGAEFFLTNKHTVLAMFNFAFKHKDLKIVEKLLRSSSVIKVLNTLNASQAEKIKKSIDALQNEKAITMAKEMQALDYYLLAQLEPTMAFERKALETRSINSSVMLLPDALTKLTREVVFSLLFEKDKNVRNMRYKYWITVAEYLFAHNAYNLGAAIVTGLTDAQLTRLIDKQIGTADFSMHGAIASVVSSIATAATPAISIGDTTQYDTNEGRLTALKKLFEQAKLFEKRKVQYIGYFEDGDNASLLRDAIVYPNDANEISLVDIRIPLTQKGEPEHTKKSSRYLDVAHMSSDNFAKNLAAVQARIMPFTGDVLPAPLLKRLNDLTLKVSSAANYKYYRENLAAYLDAYQRGDITEPFSTYAAPLGTDIIFTIDGNKDEDSPKRIGLLSSYSDLATYVTEPNLSKAQSRVIAAADTSLHPYLNPDQDRDYLMNYFFHLLSENDGEIFNTQDVFTLMPEIVSNLPSDPKGKGNLQITPSHLQISPNGKDTTAKELLAVFNDIIADASQHILSTSEATKPAVVRSKLRADHFVESILSKPFSLPTEKTELDHLNPEIVIKRKALNKAYVDLFHVRLLMKALDEDLSLPAFYRFLSVNPKTYELFKFNQNDIESIYNFINDQYLKGWLNLVNLYPQYHVTAAGVQEKTAQLLDNEIEVLLNVLNLSEEGLNKVRWFYHRNPIYRNHLLSKISDIDRIYVYELSGDWHVDDFKILALLSVSVPGFIQLDKILDIYNTFNVRLQALTQAYVANNQENAQKLLTRFGALLVQDEQGIADNQEASNNLQHLSAAIRASININIELSGVLTTLSDWAQIVKHLLSARTDDNQIGVDLLVQTIIATLAQPEYATLLTEFQKLLPEFDIKTWLQNTTVAAFIRDKTLPVVNSDFTESLKEIFAKYKHKNELKQYTDSIDIPKCLAKLGKADTHIEQYKDLVINFPEHSFNMAQDAITSPVGIIAIKTEVIEAEPDTSVAEPAHDENMSASKIAAEQNAKQSSDFAAFVFEQYEAKKHELPINGNITQDVLEIIKSSIDALGALTVNSTNMDQVDLMFKAVRDNYYVAQTIPFVYENAGIRKEGNIFVNDIEFSSVLFIPHMLDYAEGSILIARNSGLDDEQLAGLIQSIVAVTSFYLEKIRALPDPLSEKTVSTAHQIFNEEFLDSLISLMKKHTQPSGSKGMTKPEQNSQSKAYANGKATFQDILLAGNLVTMMRGYTTVVGISDERTFNADTGESHGNVFLSISDPIALPERGFAEVAADPAYQKMAANHGSWLQKVYEEHSNVLTRTSFPTTTREMGNANVRDEQLFVRSNEEFELLSDVLRVGFITPKDLREQKLRHNNAEQNLVEILKIRYKEAEDNFKATFGEWLADYSTTSPIYFPIYYGTLVTNNDKVEKGFLKRFVNRPFFHHKPSWDSESELVDDKQEAMKRVAAKLDSITETTKSGIKPQLIGTNNPVNEGQYFPGVTQDLSGSNQLLHLMSDLLSNLKTSAKLKAYLELVDGAQSTEFSNALGNLIDYFTDQHAFNRIELGNALNKLRQYLYLNQLVKQPKTLQDKGLIDLFMAIQAGVYLKYINTNNLQAAPDQQVDITKENVGAFFTHLDEEEVPLDKLESNIPLLRAVYEQTIVYGMKGMLFGSCKSSYDRFSTVVMYSRSLREDAYNNEGWIIAPNAETDFQARMTDTYDQRRETFYERIKKNVARGDGPNVAESTGSTRALKRGEIQIIISKKTERKSQMQKLMARILGKLGFATPKTPNQKKEKKIADARKEWRGGKLFHLLQDKKEFLIEVPYASYQSIQNRLQLLEPFAQQLKSFKEKKYSNLHFDETLFSRLTNNIDIFTHIKMLKGMTRKELEYNEKFLATFVKDMFDFYNILLPQLLTTYQAANHDYDTNRRGKGIRTVEEGFLVMNFADLQNLQTQLSTINTINIEKQTAVLAGALTTIITANENLYLASLQKRYWELSQQLHEIEEQTAISMPDIDLESLNATIAKVKTNLNIFKANPRSEEALITAAKLLENLLLGVTYEIEPRLAKYVTPNSDVSDLYSAYDRVYKTPEQLPQRMRAESLARQLIPSEDGKKVISLPKEEVFKRVEKIKDKKDKSASYSQTSVTEATTTYAAACATDAQDDFTKILTKAANPHELLASLDKPATAGDPPEKAALQQSLNNLRTAVHAIDSSLPVTLILNPTLRERMEEFNRHVNLKALLVGETESLFELTFYLSSYEFRHLPFHGVPPVKIPQLGNLELRPAHTITEVWIQLAEHYETAHYDQATQLQVMNHILDLAFKTFILKLTTNGHSPSAKFVLINEIKVLISQWSLLFTSTRKNTPDVTHNEIFKPLLQLFDLKRGDYQLKREYQQLLGIKPVFTTTRPCSIEAGQVDVPAHHWVPPHAV